jgi:hypothetical protein
MSTTVYLDSTPYDIPVTDETGWGDDVTAWIIDAAAKITARHSFTNQSALELCEAAANGTNKVSLRAPSAVASDYTITLPGSIGTAGVLMISDVGVLSVGAPLNLDNAYDNGKTIAVDDGPIVLNKSDNTNAIHTYKSALGAGACYSALNAGTGDCFYGDQTGVGFVAQLIQEAANAGLYVNKTNVGVGAATHVHNLGTGQGIYVDQVGAGYGIQVDQAAAVAGVFVNMGAAASGLVVDKTNAGGGDVVSILNAGTGDGLNIAQTGAAPAVYIGQAGHGESILIDHSDEGDASVIEIANSGVGTGIKVVNTANGLCGYFSKATGALDCVSMYNAGTGSCLALEQDSGVGVGLTVIQRTNAHGISVVKSGTGTGTAGYLEAAGTGVALYAKNTNAAGTAAAFTSSGENGSGLQVSHEGAGTGYVLSLLNSGTGNYITADVWSISNVGHLAIPTAALNTLTLSGGIIMTPRGRTIASDAITITAVYGTITLTPETGNNDNLATITGGTDGQIIILRCHADTDDITVVQSDNIAAAANRHLNDTADRMVLQYDSGNTKWCELSFSDNL